MTKKNISMKATILIFLLIANLASARKGSEKRKGSSAQRKRNLSIQRKDLAWNDDMLQYDNSVDNLFDRLEYARKSCKRSGKGSGCRPTASPSSPPSTSLSPSVSPTLSLAPSSKPSLTPSATPSNSPSMSPSSFPSESPSFFPTKVPSTRPSTLPTVSSSPSKEPSHSPSSVPSDKPSLAPSSKPTSKPTLNPSTGPSVMPSLGPTQSLMPSSPPSIGPSSTPSYSPSKQPTVTPSVKPSQRPSLEPTVMPSSSNRPSDKPSFAPSLKPSHSPSKQPTAMPSTVPTQFQLVATDFVNGTVSTCTIGPSQPGTTEEQALAFKYNLYILKEANGVDAAFTMENRLHYEMIDKFLACDYDDLTTFHIISISSNPQDRVTSDECDTANDPVPSVDTECVVVIAQMKMEAFFPSRRLQQTNANEIVLDVSGEYLDSAMADGDFNGGPIVQTSFQGFVNIFDSNGGNAQSNNSNGIQAATSPKVSNKKSNMVVSSAIAGLGTLCLLLVIVLSLHRGLKRQERYLKHLQDLSSVSDLSTEDLYRDQKIHIVNEDFDDLFSLDDLSSDIQQEELPLRHPNVHYCASATCPACCSQERLGPTFVTVSLSDDANEDLAPRTRISYKQDGRKYMASNTVEL